MRSAICRRSRTAKASDETEYADPPATPYQIGMRAGSPLLRDHVARPLRPTQAARLASIGPGQGLRDLPDALRPRSGYSGAYGRLTWEAPAPTITRWVFHPGSGRYGHPRDPRVITIREAARLQSFPDSFTFCGTYIQKAHQVGNAVPPLLMRALAVEMARLLTGDRGPGRG
ncbi:MAG: DNA cytosine methyltransferase [Anaerolineae bacterium]|nr:DNA cytosine methyltransferase [Anaerolineae bacterium]